ncbi:hypothetical protein QQ020_07540 [Fulvivirgaceae bacterium BMA12]|uniref:Lipoprotein n=1 Tax=Agaribacillus aureus TaxID=3051825 RepID=A0ABT8L2G0_9BACT|nr:hypothetical protein [Fulvivirgaceae bacterium BMA12]
MKTFLQSTLFMGLISFFICAFTIETFSDFTIKVEGIEDRDLRREGLKPSEFALMTIEAKIENMRIDAVEISLGYGSGLVSATKTVKGNSLDLTEYSELAKPGGRIILKLHTITEEKDKAPVNKHFYVTLPLIK